MWLGVCLARGLGRRFLFGRLGCLCGVPFVLLPEPLDSAGGIDQLVLAGEEGVAVGTDFHVEGTAGGSRLDHVAAGTNNSRGDINGMNFGLHLRPLAPRTFPQPKRLEVWRGRPL